MTFVYVLIVVCVIGFVLFIFGREIYNMKHHKSTCKCEHKEDIKRAIKKAKKDLNKKPCCCQGKE